MRGVDELTDLLKQLAADAEEAIEHDRRAEECRARVRANLPEAYRRGAGVTLLERTIHSLYVGKTITRWVVGEPDDKPKRPRKRPGAAPTTG